MRSYYVYIVECSDKTLYTGWTADIEKRLREHNGANGAKYTRSRQPVKLVYCEKCDSISDVLKREAAIKKLSRGEKLELIGGAIK
jgi:putative endonuclease